MHSELRERVIQAGGERVWKKWFATAPRYRFRAVDRKYGISQGTVADVGCSYGMNLPHCAPGSYGIEIEEELVRVAQDIGLDVHCRDACGDLSDLPKVDAVWCSAVIEHVDSPHRLLRNLYGLLKPGGLLALHAPTIPIALWPLRLIGQDKLVRAHLASDHVNAFTPATLRFTCERAGFETVEVSPFLPLRVFNRVGQRLIDGQHYIGRAIPDWDYPAKATRRR